MTLHLHRGTRTDLLADGLGELLRAPLPDPFAEEFVIVPAKGVERWLTQRLSHRLGTGPRGADGVCAGVRFLNPRSLVALLLGIEGDDPWDPDRLVWPLLATIDDCLDEPWAAILARHLGAGRTGVEWDLRQGRRYSLARRLAGLLASYAEQRPALLAEWREDHDTDGAGVGLAADLRWQPELWRRLLDRLGNREPGSPQLGPDVRQAATMAALRAGAPLAVPERLSMFGHTRLSASELSLLGALAERIDVHLWLPQVSPAAWAALAPVVVDGPCRRRQDTSAAVVGHPLLASLGRDARELQRSLSALPGVRDEPVVAPDGAGPETLLGWLQADLRANAEPGAVLRSSRRHRADDGSVQVHACHGAARQVEVLREVLVGLLQDDPTLEPRDILVMCPDIEAYAPLIQADFGLGATGAARHPAHALRVRLADRGLANTNPLLALAGALVTLAGSRASASEVLDLISRDAVRARFGLDDKAVDQVSRWVEQAAIRWGISQDLRAAYHLDGIGQNTWREGLDRVLLGVSMAGGEQLVGDRLPLDDLASAQVDLAGRFVEILDRLEGVVRRLQAAGPAREWVQALLDGVLALADVPERDRWQISQFARELRAIADVAGPDELRLTDVRSLLEHRLAGRPTRSNFRTGSLTIATLVPMRSVPHRVVCLLGIDDGVFPRAVSADGDDALARDPLTGERDQRSEDRQLLLDAILATRETLVVTYSGASEHTDRPRPPAVPIGELLDALDRTTAAPLRERIVRRHPLQPFDERNLIPAADGQPFSFDGSALAGARAAREERRTPRLLTGEVAAVLEPDVTVADLVGFFVNPAKAFLRSIEVATPWDVSEPVDAIPIDLNGLEKWQVGDRIIAGLLGGADSDALVAAELHRGELPPGELGEETLREIAGLVQSLLVDSAAYRSPSKATPEVIVELGAGRRLIGTISEVYAEQLVRTTYSTLKAKHACAAWIEVLALQAARPDLRLTGHYFGKVAKSRTGHGVLGPVDPEFARDHLRRLVELRDTGMRRPLPLPVETGRAWALASARSGEMSATAAARRVWSPDNSPVPGENEDASWVRLLGRKAPLSALPGLGAVADSTWHPLLGHERGWPR